ncbi:MAG: alpha/beta hydrolase [Pseudomonadales bacterium]
MFDVSEVSRWLGEHTAPRCADDSIAIAHYRKFYDLNIEGARHEMGLLQVGADQICVQRFAYRRDPVGTVFVLHGYLDHSGLQSKIVRRLLQRGFDVVLYDQPGHGLSSGDRASIDSFQHYVDCLSSCVAHYAGLSTPYSVIGHSMGGAVSMTHLLQEPGVFHRAVLVAPLYRPRSWRLLRSLHVVGRKFVDRQPRQFMKNTMDEKFIHFIREIDPLSPKEIPTRWVTSMFDWVKYFDTLGQSDAKVLIVQGTLDGTVDWRGNIKIIRKKFANVRIHLVGEGRHHLLNEIDEISQQAWEAIDPFLGEHR